MAIEPGSDRSGLQVVGEVRRLLREGMLDLPLPGLGRTGARWSALAALGRHDLCAARLAEGHVDAVAILKEAGRDADPHTLYGVWASRSRGARVQAERRESSWVLGGTIAFCSGAGLIDRALITAFAAEAGTEPDPSEQLLFDVQLAQPGVRPLPGTWPALGMDATASLHVAIDSVSLPDYAAIGEPGYYTRRPGFQWGGAGVAAVWLGGAAAAVDAATTAAGLDAHRAALLGSLMAQLAAADALLARTAAELDERSRDDHTTAAMQCRAVAEAVARQAIATVPMVVGPARLSQDRRLAQHLADLQLYIGQYHTGADPAMLAERARSGPDACH